MRQERFVLLGVTILFFGFMVNLSFGTEVKKFVLGSGPMGGPWRIGVGAGVQVLNEQLKDKYSFTAAASGGSVENVRRMMSGEYHSAWAHLSNIYDAWNGVGIFEGDKPFKEMRALEKMSDAAFCVTTLAKSPIRSFMDLVGKKVCAGPAGSGNVPIAKAVFKALGIADKVKMTYISFEAAAQALKDGQLDVTMLGGGPYVPPPILEISRTVAIRIVEPTPEEAKKIEAELPYLSLGAIPPNSAPGENADKERKAFFFSIYWIALQSMPEEVVYDMLKITQDPKNKEVLGKVLNFWATASPDFVPTSRIGIPLHPGAVRYWKERGVTLPEVPTK